MRILCVTAALPVDPRRDLHGLHLRLRSFLDAAGLIGELSILGYVAPPRDDSSSSAAALERGLAEAWGVRARVRLCRDRRGAPRRSGLAAYLAPALDPFASRVAFTVGERQQQAFEDAVREGADLILVHRLAAAFPALRARGPLPTLVFDLDDVEHVALRREIPLPPRWPGKRLWYLQIPALALAERRAARLAAATFVCSERDRRYLARLRVPRVEVIENAVALPAMSPIPRAPTVLFLGRLSYPPNRAAAERLLADVWPRVRRAVPDARLIIAGSFPEEIAGRAAAGSEVEFPGFVEDLDALYARARVVCCPVDAGSGTRLKLIEAAAHGRPIVSTTVGAEGLGLVPGVHFERADGSVEFAAACARLLRDDPACRRLGDAARGVALERWDRARAVPRIAERLRALHAGKDPR